MRLILARTWFRGLAGSLFLLVALMLGGVSFAVAAELSVEDFSFKGPSGCGGASIEKIGTNHFKATLGHAPRHPDWCNMLQFRILRHAKGNRLRLDVVFKWTEKEPNSSGPKGGRKRLMRWPSSSWNTFCAPTTSGLPSICQLRDMAGQ